MNLSFLVLAIALVFWAAYRIYGRFLAKVFALDPHARTPAWAQQDGVDFAPAKKQFLLGQHFSAIAAAGPIVGPILAGVSFGWLPAVLWIVFGAVFFGAVHDFASLVGSVKHEAKSVAELMKDYLGHRAYLLFMAFIWLSLVYVITAFTDLTSASFMEAQYGGGVAASSMAYLFLAVAMGFALERFRMPLWIATLIFLPIVGFVIWYGQFVPIRLGSQFQWNAVILAYCFIASITPMWALLQPRGYLGGFFLYIALAAGVVGLFLSGDKVQYPAFLGFTSATGLPLFPMLFVTIACGACSGFHGLVSSGTTSKQISHETDCHLVGYGGMLLEGLVAVLALATVMILSQSDPQAGLQPDRIYANGLAHFVQQFGVNENFARSFALLAFATFIYDTLDVATRLGRYILQELTGWKGNGGRTFATFLTLALPACFLCVTGRDAAGNTIPAWRLFWTIFGTSNQLLAALSLLGITVWLKRKNLPWIHTALPMLFMTAVTLWSLGFLMKSWFSKILSGNLSFDLVGPIAIVLFLLAALLIKEAWHNFRRPI